MNYYLILFYRRRAEESDYTVLITKAPSQYEAEKKANKELKEWNDYTSEKWSLQGVSWFNGARLEDGAVVALTTI